MILKTVDCHCAYMLLVSCHLIDELKRQLSFQGQSYFRPDFPEQCLLLKNSLRTQFIFMLMSNIFA